MVSELDNSKKNILLSFNDLVSRIPRPKNFPNNLFGFHVGVHIPMA